MKGTVAALARGACGCWRDRQSCGERYGRLAAIDSRRTAKGSDTLIALDRVAGTADVASGAVLHSRLRSMCCIRLTPGGSCGGAAGAAQHSRQQTAQRGAVRKSQHSIVQSAALGPAHSLGNIRRSVMICSESKRGQEVATKRS